MAVIGDVSCVPMARKSTPERRKAFTRKLLAWYKRAARDLPWRRTRDPYAIVVSEFMLQQTQVSRVTEYYPTFLERFPTVYDLARARPKAVREAWDGLGYYARASNLHALARVVSRDFDGRVPENPQALVKLPGVGPYTAGAVASFAYEKPVPAVDTNVARVIRRVFLGDDGQRPTRQRSIRQRSIRQRSTRQRLIWSLAASLVPKDGKRAWKF